MQKNHPSHIIDMTDGPLFGNIIRYAVPLMLTGVLQLLFNAADLVVVGRYCGRLSIAAVGATGAIINLIVNLFIGLSVGVGVTVAVSLGAHDDERCSRAVHTCIPVALIGGAVLTVFGLLYSPTFLGWMKTPADVIGLSSLYMRIYFCGMIPSLLFNYGAAVLRAAGDTKHPLYYLMTAGVVNVVLNVIFVVAFDLDVAGVALATALSQCLSAFLILRFLMRQEGPYRFVPAKMRVHAMELAQIIRIGIPAGVQGCMFSISNVIIQSSINSFGSVTMAGNSAGANLEGFTWISMNAFHQAGMNFVGQNVGAHKLDRVRRVRNYCLLDVAACGVVFGGLTYLFAHQLLAVYIPGDEEAIRYGITRMTFVCLPYFLCGLQDVMTGIIRGLGQSLVPMIITILDICVFRIVWIYTIWQVPRYHTLNMLYVTYPITWILSFVMLTICYAVIMRRLTRREAAYA